MLIWTEWDPMGWRQNWEAESLTHLPNNSIFLASSFLVYLWNKARQQVQRKRNFNDPDNLLEKAMAPYSSTLAWKILWTEEPGRLQSMGSLRVEHDWATSLSLFTFMHWRRKWQSTPVFLPGESQGQGSLVGCCLWGHRESDTTEAT